jgi:hypothetical protein
MMERPMMKAMTGFALRGEGNLAGDDGKVGAAVVIELELVNVEASVEAVEAIQRGVETISPSHLRLLQHMPAQLDQTRATPCPALHFT